MSGQAGENKKSDNHVHSVIYFTHFSIRFWFTLRFENSFHPLIVFVYSLVNDFIETKGKYTKKYLYGLYTSYPPKCRRPLWEISFIIFFSKYFVIEQLHKIFLIDKMNINLVKLTCVVLSKPPSPSPFWCSSFSRIHAIQVYCAWG